jgi:hypothetical protein
MAQSLYCSRCAEVATFVNMGIVQCPCCNHTNLVRLPSISDSSRLDCEKCRGLVTAREPSVRIYPLGRFEEEKGHDEGLRYCGLDYFNGYLAEVSIAKTALERVADSSRRMFGLLPPKPKKAMFVRRVDPVPNRARELPFTRLCFLHAYCNFSIARGHNNAKLLGRFEYFASGLPFRLFVEEHGLVNIWFADAELMREIQSFPPVAAYAKRFQVA